MKKILLILSSLILMISCSTKNVDIKFTDTSINGVDIKTYTIDGCEYIGVVTGTNSDILTHKGNCSNPIHYQKNNLEKVLKSEKDTLILQNNN
jgi:hypothetical protein